MRPDVLIVGQGLAGTLLGWELERVGLNFAIADPGRADTASRTGAGIINPITGRRLVKTWRADTLIPAARAKYRELEAALGVRLWRDLRIRRLFADEGERRAFASKRAELAAFTGEVDASGFWIERAGWVDVAVLLTAVRERWQRRGRLQEVEIDPIAATREYALVIDCTGGRAARGAHFKEVPWEFSKGELIEIAVAGLAPDVALNQRHWVLPVGEGKAWVGATHEPGVTDSQATAAAREMLETSARTLLARPFTFVRQRAGMRVNLPDKRPVAGRHPQLPALGIVNALGAKGTLLAPYLATQWLSHLQAGRAFESEIALNRFVC